jgi:triphosphoribosyl-dephospho-CoA synthase
VCAFPHVLQAGLPALRRARQAGIAEECARLDALLSIMATLDDTCLLHRGGRAALDTAQQGAACVLSMGGSSTLAGLLELGRLHQRLMRLWASPGGSADLLAATLFLDRLSSVERRDQHDGDV